MEHIKIEIKGKFTKYAKLIAEQGYCFYDVEDEERKYITEISTPITNENQLNLIYIVIKGNAEELNKKKEISNG
jgi:hypothetical protein